MENNTLELIENLKKLNVTIVEDLNSLNNIFDIEIFKKNINSLKTKKDVVLFFDNQSYNNNTFTDNIIKFLKDFEKITFNEFSKIFHFDNTHLKEELDFFNSLKTKVVDQLKITEIYYCNDKNVFDEIFANFYDNKETIQPTILSFKNYNNEKETDCFIEFEKLNVLNLKTIIKVFINLNNLK